MRSDKNDKNNGRVLHFFLALVMVIGGSARCFAHPMGNFSVNHYSKITIGQNSIEILYLVDMAEIPTYQEIRESGLVAKADDPSIARYLERMEPILKAGLSLSFENNGRGLQLETIDRRVTFAEGAGGLPTMKIGFVFRGHVDSAAGVQQVSYTDNNFPGRAGWKEIVVVGAGPEILTSSAPETDRSHELTIYSSDALNSPPQQLTASVSYRAVAVDAGSGTAVSADRTSANVPGSKKPALETHTRRQSAVESQASVPPLRSQEDTSAMIATRASFGAPQPMKNRAQNTPRSRFTDLISNQSGLSFWFLLSAAMIAAGLGALHALEPGHGKTIVAAYLVGSRGTARHAVLLGIVVTAAHTSGVFFLGAVTLYASRYIVPEQLYPWLGAISGLSVAGLGVFTFLRHQTGETGDHSHAAGERHSHWFLSMSKSGTIKRDSEESENSAAGLPTSQAASQSTGRALSLRELCVLGVTGGIVPCPAALVVLLSAFSLHRIGFGLFLITAFSLGLAGVLVVVGMTMVYTKRLMAARLQAGGAALRYLPMLSSAFMVVLGIGIACSAIGSLQFAHGLITRDKLVPFVTVVLLGLFLGMRHSTDADHVVAVSTIVSRQGSIRSSAAIGLLWGLGHTLTIFFIGSAIIIFGVVIPPRVGLSMEFCVALMLILLGVLNLTGVMSWITNRLTPGASAHKPDDGAGKNTQSAGRIQSLMEKFAGNLGMFQTLRPLVVGLVHGLAGSAAVALLVLSTIKSPLWSTAYLLVFGFGTMVGMMIMTAAISLPVVYTGKKFLNVNRHLTVISGMASVAFGMFLVYQIGIVDGLFSSHVHWIPQ
jgi:ABC-type nickel/cobalt efflux system permease component RcnA